MINDKIKKQEGGDNSTNYQADVINVHQKLNYTEVREIALDVFKANFIQLSKDAMEVVYQRVDKFTDEYLKVLKDKEILNLNFKFKDPALQSNLYEAQKQYAKIGDDKLMEMLISVLVDLTMEKSRTLKYIALEESISIIPKLTKEQIDLLSLIFVITELCLTPIPNLDEFDAFISKYISPFTETIPTKNKSYSHLVFTGCIERTTNMTGVQVIEGYFINNYGGLFMQGFSKSELLEISLEEEKIDKIICECLHDSSKSQLCFLNIYEFEQQLEEMKINKDELLIKYKKNIMPHNKIRSLISSRNPQMEKTFSLWDSHIQKFKLTTIGTCIGICNLFTKTNIKLDIGTWIN